MKTGFIYIWYDKKHNRYYIGCHVGTEDDGYVCSSRWMRKSFKRRPQDFKRRVVQRDIPRENLLEEEHKWLSLIPDNELGKRYYNLSKKHFGHWSNDDNNRLSISEKVSIKTKEAMNTPEMRAKMQPVWDRNRGRKQPEETIKKRADKHRGRKNTEETRRKMSEAAKNVKHAPLKESTKQKLREVMSGPNNPFYGRSHSEETKQKLRKLCGNKYWNDGTKNIRSKECPGPGWVSGRTKKIKT